MTTSPGWERRPGPTRGDTARRPRPAVAGGWPADAPDGGRGPGPAVRAGRSSDADDPRRRDPRGSAANGPGNPRSAAGSNRPQGPRSPVDPSALGAPREPRDGLDSLRSSSLLRWLGTISGRNAVLVLVAATLLGIVCTLVAGSEPGFLLGFFVTVGSVVATLGIRRGAVYLMFPLPAFALFLAAVMTGKIHDSSLTSSTTGLGVGFLQWIADVFFPMVIATIAVLVVAGIRWLLAYQLVIGQFSTSGGRGGASPGARPAPRPDPPGLPGDQRTDRDRWGDPRPPGTGPRARDGRPAAPPPPRDRAPRPPARPSWDPRPQQPDQPPRPARPPGPGPRDPWDQR